MQIMFWNVLIILGIIRGQPEILKNYFMQADIEPGTNRQLDTLSFFLPPTLRWDTSVYNSRGQASQVKM